MAKRRANDEGTTYKCPNGRYRAQVLVSGKRISFYGDTEGECEAWIKHVKYQRKRGLDFMTGEITLGQFIEKWFEIHKKKIRETTQERYQSDIDRYIVPNIGHIPLKNLHPFDIEEFYSTLTDKGVSARGVRHVHAVLHVALEKAVLYELIYRNPSHGVDLPRYSTPEMQYLDENQVFQLLLAAESSRHKTLYRIAIATGMRQGEIFGLQWRDLDWNRGVLHVRRQVQRITGQGWKFAEPKSKASTRTFPLGEAIMHELRLRKKSQLKQIAFVREAWQENGLIFPSTVGTPPLSQQPSKGSFENSGESRSGSDPIPRSASYRSHVNDN